MSYFNQSIRCSERRCTATSPSPVLIRALWQWLVSAALLILCVPAVRCDSVIGYLPLWLLALPAAALITVCCPRRP